MSERRVVSARSDGQKLYLKHEPAGPEVAYDWTGPAGAHHATTEMSESTHVYTTKHELKIRVYDAAGTLLGELTKEHGD
jgi:hypothetical protein